MPDSSNIVEMGECASKQKSLRNAVVLSLLFKRCCRNLRNKTKFETRRLFAL